MKRLLPGRIRRWLRDAEAAIRLHRACGQLRRLPPGGRPSHRLLERLLLGWRNFGFASTPEYLRVIAEAVLDGEGPILECGTGASTLLVGILADKVGRPVCSLEHDAAWHSTIGSALARQGVRGVHVALAPLRDYGDYSWYDVSNVDLPGPASLVICDGPPSETPGGRSGLLRVGRRFLRPGTTILFDDAAREPERTMLREWGAAGLIRFEVEKGASRSHAVATVC